MTVFTCSSCGWQHHPVQPVVDCSLDEGKPALLSYLENVERLPHPVTLRGHPVARGIPRDLRSAAGVPGRDRVTLATPFVTLPSLPVYGTGRIPSMSHLAPVYAYGSACRAETLDGEDDAEVRSESSGEPAEYHSRS